jgi:environmental stress-induced protein Ves
LARAELPDGSGFAWRLSVADIEKAGPFSDFRGYRRQLVMLDGTGLCLHGPGTGSVRLEQPGDMHEFDGADAIAATLHGGPCRDVNIMTAHAAACHWEVQLQRGTPQEIAGAFVLFPVRGEWRAHLIDHVGEPHEGAGLDASASTSASASGGGDPPASLIVEPGNLLVKLHARSAFCIDCAGGGLAILLRLHPHHA